MSEKISDGGLKAKRDKLMVWVANAGVWLRSLVPRRRNRRGEPGLDIELTKFERHVCAFRNLQTEREKLLVRLTDVGVTRRSPLPRVRCRGNSEAIELAMWKPTTVLPPDQKAAFDRMRARLADPSIRHCLPRIAEPTDGASSTPDEPGGDRA